MSPRTSRIGLVVKRIVGLFWSLSVTVVTSAESEPQGVTAEQLNFFEKNAVRSSPTLPVVLMISP